MKFVVRIVSILLSLQVLCITSCRQFEGESADFYFVQITDTHFDGGLHNRRTEAVIGAVNSLPFDFEFVVITGDIMADNIENDEIAESGVEILGRSRAPVHLMPGNHDILEKRPLETGMQYQKYFGPISSSATYKGVRMIFFYSEPLRRNVRIEGYEPFDWLENELEKSKGMPVIIFHHTPTSVDFYRNAFHQTWRQDIRQKFDKMVNSYNVKAVIAGHFHRGEMHWMEDVPLFVAPSIASYWGRQASFRIYHYRKGRLSYHTQYIDDNRDLK